MKSGASSGARVLLTGARGFVGRHCIPLLLREGYEVHAVASPARAGGVSRPEAPGVQWHEMDLLRDGGGEALFARVQASHWLHLAWAPAVPGQFWRDESNFRWVEVSMRLLRAFAAGGGKRAVMAGTSAEYNWNFGFCSERYTPLDPTTPYGICKHALHQMARSWADENGVELGWGRVFFLYGPHEYPQRLVASVVRALLQGEEAPCSQGAQMRDFLHVADVASAFVATLKSDFTGSFNIASGEPVSVRHVVSSIAQQIGREELVKFGALASPPGDPIMLAADPSRLRHEMGWSPEFTLSSGLAHTIRWWRRELSL